MNTQPTTPKHMHSPNSTLDWTTTPTPGYKSSTKYPGYYWKKKDTAQPTPQPEPVKATIQEPSTPILPSTLTPIETYEVHNSDGETVELVRRYVYLVTEQAEEPEPIATPEPWYKGRTTAGETLTQLRKVKTAWETIHEDARKVCNKPDIPNGKRVRHGDMVLFGDTSTPACGLIYAAHLRDLCKVWAKSQELALVCTPEGLDIYPLDDTRSNKIHLNWRAYDPKFEDAIIKFK